jgi:hypothetical protein
MLVRNSLNGKLHPMLLKTECVEVATVADARNQQNPVQEVALW